MPADMSITKSTGSLNTLKNRSDLRIITCWPLCQSPLATYGSTLLANIFVKSSVPPSLYFSTAQFGPRFCLNLGQASCVLNIMNFAVNYHKDSKVSINLL